MAKYTRLPLEVDAQQYDGDLEALFEFVLSFGNPSADRPVAYRDRDGVTWVITTEGPVTLSVGSWLVRGPFGDWYPVLGSIFVQTFEEIGARPIGRDGSEKASAK
jgi:hypothetical protein